MDNIVIKQVKIDEPLYAQIYDLREEILRKPIGLSLKDEDLSGDALDIIFGALQNDKIIGCLMLHPADRPDKIKFRQMAIANEWQGKGIGQQLMIAAEEYSWNAGKTKIALHARVSAQGFYERLGYTTTSGVFTEVGIPHVVMEKYKP